MSSDQLIAVATDALRGLIQAAIPQSLVVSVGPPSTEGSVASGLSLHLFRIGVLPLVRAVPTIGSDGRRVRPELGLQLDYLLSGQGGEVLQELQLLGAALLALVDSPVRERQSLPVLLSEPDRLAALSAGAFTVQWRLLELPVGEQCQVWLASGMRQRGGVFCRAEAVWQAVPG